MKTYLELKSVHFEVDSSGRVASAWLEAPGMDDLDIFDHLTAYEFEQLEERAVEIQASDPDDGLEDYLYDRRNDDLLNGDL